MRFILMSENNYTIVTIELLLFRGDRGNEWKIET